MMRRTPNLSAQRWKPININARGIDMFLGPLEAAIMRAIWSDHRHSKQIYKHVRDNYQPSKTNDEISYSSVTSTVFRVCQQGYLTRSGDRNVGFTYTPIHSSEADFINEHMRAALLALVESYPREAGRLMVEYFRSLHAPAEEGLTK